MSTHRRAWKQRAGVVVALVFGALLAVPATPASAARITDSTGSVTIDAGKSSPVNVEVTPDTAEVGATINITGLPDGVSCGGCGQPIQFNGSPAQPKPQSVTLTLSAAPNAPAANGTRATIRVEGTAGSDARPLSVTVKATAPPTQQQPQTVKSISGKVVAEANGDPVAGAVVMLRDSVGKQRQTTTDGSGNFRFSGSTSEPIAPGRIDLGANKDGKIGTKSFDAAAGQSVTGQRISVPVKVEASPSATPSATEEALPSDEATDEATDEPASEQPAAQQPAANEDSGSFGSWLLILLGGLFVAVGVGTIVLLYMRRKNEDGDGDGDGPHGPTGPGGPAGAAGAVPGARGAYRGADDQTRVVNGMGAGAAPTMVGGTSLSDAPTMMHRPVVDDVPPDPYGAPPGPAYGAGAGAGQAGWAGNGYGDGAPGQGGYGGGDNGYGAAPSSGGGYGAAPSSGGGYGSRDYGAGAAGYPPAQGGGYGGERYDEPTGRYTGDSTQYAPPADPYPTSTYQPDQGRGYDQPGQGQYGRGPEQGGNGYGSGGGYGGGQQGGYDNGPAGGYSAGQQGGYDNAPAGGYDSGQTGGYDGRQGGYDGGQQGGFDGYDQRGGYGGGDGYGQPQQGGYGQPSGYGQEQPPQQRGGGYDNQGYDQGGYYADPAEAGRGRPDAPQDRGGRRLDWLDD
ncbi:carboxypeptidase-like regulatory domain-containing protein [Micromonospora chersina]|uniref:carboxypeptidase-like regulatory domain-containing protein n=1 Tax=Micromonospora chersina TaxID=47854 RepID=UPI0033C54EDC